MEERREKLLAQLYLWVLGDVQDVDFIVACWNLALELQGQVQTPAPPVNSSVTLEGLLYVYWSLVYLSVNWGKTYLVGLPWALSESLVGAGVAYQPGSVVIGDCWQNQLCGNNSACSLTYCGTSGLKKKWTASASSNVFFEDPYVLLWWHGVN